jgi:glucose-1-phosphate thymidylyltransferase
VTAPDEAIGLIPAAGKGVRLGLPYPKELYPVIRDNRYKPVAQFVLDNLVAAGVRHCVFVVNETKHQLVGYFGSGQRFGCHISYVVQEQAGSDDRSTSPGLAHALDAAYHLTRDRLVLFGMPDTIMQPRGLFLQAMAACRPDDDAVLVLFPTDRPQKFGMVRMEPDGRVLEVVDKPTRTSLTHMWGCLIWRAAFTDHLHARVQQGEGDFAGIMNGAIAAGLRLRGIAVADGDYIDLGTYEEIMEMDRRLRDQ